MRMGYFDVRQVHLLPGGPVPRAWPQDGTERLPAPAPGVYMSPEAARGIPGATTFAVGRGFRGLVTMGFQRDGSGGFRPAKTGHGENLTGLGETDDAAAKRETLRGRLESGVKKYGLWAIGLALLYGYARGKL